MMRMILIATILFSVGCEKQESSSTAKSTSGVAQTSVKVQTDASGRTVEQNNISERLLRDNKPGSIKHLYIVSAYSGDVLIYSTVKGKVTSSGKRLSPTSIEEAWMGHAVNEGWRKGIRQNIGGTTVSTSEVLQDDGTYGSSIEYLYWFDSKNVYHQHYPAGGQIIHVSDQPLAVNKVILNLEAQ